MIPFSASSLLRNSAAAKPGAASQPSGTPQQGGSDFGAHLDAASHPAPSPAPAPAAPPAPPAKAQPASGTDDADDADKTAAPKDQDPSAASTTPDQNPDAIYAVAGSYLMASLPVPPPPAEAAAPAPAPSVPADGSSPASTLTLADPASLSTLTTAPATPSTLAATLPVPTGSPAATTPPATDPSAAPAPNGAAATPPAPAAATPPANSVLQLQQLQTAAENNAAVTVAAGIKLPSDGASDSSAKDESATNATPTDAKAKKTSGKEDQTPIPSALDTLLPNLGTVNSDTSAMPVMTPIFAAPPQPDAGIGFAAPPPKGDGKPSAPAVALKGIGNAVADNSPAASATGTNSNLQAGSAALQAPSQPVVERVVTQVGNAQFIDVIRQSLNEQPMVTPQRISIELQTPPGETVTVFFSQSNGQLRAQLSASDSGSMQWLQQQVDTLKQSTGGPSVLWLPPQLDQQNAGQQQGQTPHQQQRQNAPAPRGDDDAALADSLFGSIETLTNA